MAKLVGMFPVLGTVDNITFARGKNGTIIVKRKTSMTKERMQTDPAFIRVRETMATFKAAGQAARFALFVFREVVTHKSDGQIFSRVQKKMIEVTYSDQSHPRGQQRPEAGDLSLLRGFEFNANALFEASFWGNATGSIDRVTGEVELTIGAHNPEDLVNKPGQAKYYRFVTGGVALDIAGETYQRVNTKSAWLPWGNTVTTPVTLICGLDPASTLPLFQVAGIEYAGEKDGVKYSLNDGAYNAVKLIGTDI